jgi:catechol 2,3-dioxygenase-like lactoylglutathione lyase family enzyme
VQAVKGIDHVNLVVSDLPAMVRFYTVVMGMRLTKHVNIGGKWIDEVVGLEGVEAEVVYLELPTGPRLELIRYMQPAGEMNPGRDRPNLHGLRHVAFAVEDLDGQIERLEQAGVRLIGPARQVPDEQVKYAGGVRKRLVYFTDPEGNLLELCEYASGEDAG